MKYYTAFIFEDTDTTGIHCTHKFLGSLTDDEADLVGEIIDVAWRNRPKLPEIVFDREKFFGPQKDIRVLIPSKPNTVAVTQFTDFDNLRAALCLFRKDDYALYNPHVTTDLPLFDKPVIGYALMSGKEIVRSWKQ